MGKQRKKQNLLRNGVYSIDAVLDKIVDWRCPDELAGINFDGESVKMNSLRYWNFKEHGVTCVTCGLVGAYFVMEKHRNETSYHFNLYAIDERGEEVLMTRDHIIPKSRGGEDTVENSQPMCVTCNGRKGNRLDGELGNPK